jgi:hypothetical protein
LLAMRWLPGFEAGFDGPRLARPRPPPDGFSVVGAQAGRRGTRRDRRADRSWGSRDRQIEVNTTADPELLRRYQFSRTGCDLLLGIIFDQQPHIQF